MMKKTRTQNQKAFSLIEMMILVTVIGISSAAFVRLSMQQYSQERNRVERMNWDNYTASFYRYMIDPNANFCTKNFVPGAPVPLVNGTVIPGPFNIYGINPASIPFYGPAGTIPGSNFVKPAIVTLNNVVQVSGVNWTIEVDLNYNTTGGMISPMPTPSQIALVQVVTDGASPVPNMLICSLTPPAVPPKGFATHVFMIPDNATWTPLGNWDMCVDGGSGYAGMTGGTQMVKSGPAGPGQPTAGQLADPGVQNADGTWTFQAYNERDPCYATPQWPVVCYVQGTPVSGTLNEVAGGPGGAACPAASAGGICSISDFPPFPAVLNCTIPASTVFTPYGPIVTPAQNEQMSCQSF